MEAAALMNTKQNSLNAVMIIPSDVKVSGSSEKIKKTILKIISSVTEKLKVKNVKRISGNGILVETAGQKDFATFLGNQRSKEAGFVIGALAKKSSRIIIYDIPRMESR